MSTQAEINAYWLHRNHNTAIYYGAAVGGTIAAFSIAHYGPKALDKVIPKWSSWSGVKRTQQVWRKIDHHSPTRWSGLRPSIFLLALAYIGLNLVLALYDKPQQGGLPNIGKRFGWLALCNIALAVLFGLKNTPLCPLAGQSYEGLGTLHKFVGYTTISISIMHWACMITGLEDFGVFKYVWPMTNVKWGVVVAVLLFVLLVTAQPFFRHRWYETFRTAHIILVALVLITTALHQPFIATRAFAVIAIAGGLWFLDNFLRISLWIFNGYGNYCTFTALPGEATLVTMRRGIYAHPGNHVQLWIPGIRLFQRHPFTMLSSNPVQFVIKAQGGFTRDVFEAATRNPDAKYRASVNGPYGHVPSTAGYDKVILVAGGSGATFTTSLARYWKRVGDSTLEFLWSVRDESCLEWLQAETADLATRPGINVVLHVTRPSRPMSVKSTNLIAPASPPDLSRRTSDDTAIGSGNTSDDTAIGSGNVSDGTGASTPEFEKPELMRPEIVTCPSFTSGRPCMFALLSRTLEGLGPDKKVLIAACGPSTLIRDVKRAVAQATTVKAPVLHAYYEQFSI